MNYAIHFNEINFIFILLESRICFISSYIRFHKEYRFLIMFGCFTKYVLCYTVGRTNFIQHTLYSVPRYLTILKIIIFLNSITKTKWLLLHHT